MKHPLIVLGLLAATAVCARAEEPAKRYPPLAEEIRQSDARRFESAIREGARIHPTADGKSYYLAWFPAATEGKARPLVVVTLHGNRATAFDEFEAWLPYVRERGYGVLALQWQVKDGTRRRDYLPPEIHLALQDICLREGIQPGRALLHGFSRGAAVIYSVANLDRFEGRGYFGAVIANAGAALPDYPQNLRIRERAKNGGKPFEGTKWIYYSGGQDRTAPFTSTAAIRQAAEWVRQLGGEELLFLENPKGGHLSFRQSPEYVKRAFDAFERAAAEAGSS